MQDHRCTRRIRVMGDCSSHDGSMPTVPGWTVITALLAPLLLVGGAAFAATFQPYHFDQVSYSISQLAARGASHRWVMTLFILGSGICVVLSAVGLRPVRMAGRLVLAFSGVATIAVAAFPDRWVDGRPAPMPVVDPHTISAWLVFLAAALWPTFAANRDGPLRLRWGLVLSAVQLVPAGWRIVHDISDGEFSQGTYLGLAQRVLVGFEGLVLLTVVLLARRSGDQVSGRRRARCRGAGGGGASRCSSPGTSRRRRGPTPRRAGRDS